MANIKLHENSFQMFEILLNSFRKYDLQKTIAFVW